MKKTMNTRILAIALASIFAVTFSTTVLANDEKKAHPCRIEIYWEYRKSTCFPIDF